MPQEQDPLLGINSNDDDDDFATASSVWQRIKRNTTNTFAPLADPERLRPLEKFLLVLALVLFLLSSVFIGLFAGLSTRLAHWPPPSSPTPVPSPSPGPPAPSPPDEPWEPSPPPPAEHVCTTPACVLAASDVLRSLNTSVDPCEDFYHFTTGGWLDTHPIPDDAGLFGSGQLVGAHNAQVVRKILEDAPATSPSKPTWDQQSLYKLRSFYDSCMDTSVQDNRKDQPLLELLHNVTYRFEANSLHSRSLKPEVAELDDEVNKRSFSEQLPFAETISQDADEQEKVTYRMERNPVEHPPSDGYPGVLPPASGGQTSRQARLTRALAWLHSRGIPAFFEWTVDGDSGVDPQLGTPTFEPSGLGLPDGSYYDDRQEREFYLQVVSQSFKLLPQTHKHHHHLAKQVVTFEHHLAALSDEAGEQDPIALYNPVSLSKLSHAFKSIQWTGYFSALTTRPPRAIILPDPEYPRKLDNLISRTSDKVLEAYLLWSTVRTYALNLGPHAPLRVIYDQLDRKLKGVDPDAREDRATTCVAHVNEALGFLAGRFFVQQAFSPEGKQKAGEIIGSIITAFKQRLPSIQWLDPHTRQLAEQKADAVRIKVGYPEYPSTEDAAALYAFYADLNVDPTDYFGNAVRSATRLQSRQWLYNDRPLNPLRWDMFPAEVNAYYNPTGNEIVFPAGLLQPPYFHVTWPDYLNYGAFGQTAGHELSHAFDPQGRLYDQDGYLRDWWTPSTAAEFNKRKQCILEQYGNYTVDDGKGNQLPLNARGSIGEDVADGGGIEQAFRAWNASFRADTPQSRAANAKLPGLSSTYTRDQLFFIAFGQAWARNIRITEQVKRLRTDEHSPTMYRVIGAVSNSPAFAQAFGCTPGKDPMARSKKERCAIW